MPDGGHASRYRDFLILHELDQLVGHHVSMRHDLLGTEHAGGKGHPPPHGMEHRHDTAQAVGRRQFRHVGHRGTDGVQISRAMGVHHALRLARGAAGVTQPHGRIFIQLRPSVIDRLIRDELFIVDTGLKRRAHRLRASFPANDEQFHARDAPLYRLKSGQQIFVHHDEPIVGVIDDVFEVPRAQTDIERVQHRAHARHALVHLQVTGVVPHEAGHPVTDCNAPGR